MKKVLMTATAIAAIGIAGPAFAQTTEQQGPVTFTVSGVNPAKCQINADDTTATLGSDEISNDQGRARNNVGRSVARALNQLRVHAWCTGNHNAVNLTRTPLATGDGDQTTDGFNQAVIYDIAVEIPNNGRVGDATEATEDGAGSGPSDVGRFGPDGRGARLTFANYPQGDDSSAVTSDNGGTAARTTYDGLEDNSRLVAGDYQSIVTLTITPGQI